MRSSSGAGIVSATFAAGSSYPPIDMRRVSKWSRVDDLFESCACALQRTGVALGHVRSSDVLPVPATPISTSASSGTRRTGAPRPDGRRSQAHLSTAHATNAFNTHPPGVRGGRSHLSDDSRDCLVQLGDLPLCRARRSPTRVPSITWMW